MADLFLHLPFARRLRLAEGLHPLIGETLTRRQSLVALGATLPLLPGVERNGMPWWRKMFDVFSGGSDATRWQKQLAATSTPRVELVKRLLVETTHQATPSNPLGGLGPMSRLALGLGFLSHELLEAKLQGMVPAGSERGPIERAQARLWLQAAVPNNLDVEWKATGELADAELHKRTFEHIDAALKAAFGAGPGRDALHRWSKGLVAEVTPLVNQGSQGMPTALGLADHTARGPHFENTNFVGKAQEAVSWFVVLANRLGETATRGAPDAGAVMEALCGSPTGSALLTEDGLPTDGAANAVKDRWLGWIYKTRMDTLERGRNDKPAFIEGLGEVKPIHRSNAFTGMMNLSDLPPEAHQNGAALPPPSQVLSPPVPAATMEVSLASIEAAARAAGHGPPPPLPLDASGPMPVSRPVQLPPAMTQEISIAQIEGEAHAARDFAAPAHTQQIDLAQIESEVAGFSAPAHTQQIDGNQIESSSTAPPHHAPQHTLPPLPTPPPPVPPQTTPPTSLSPQPAQDSTSNPTHAPPHAPPPPPQGGEHVPPTGPPTGPLSEPPRE